MNYVKHVYVNCNVQNLLDFTSLTALMVRLKACTNSIKIYSSGAVGHMKTEPSSRAQIIRFRQLR